MMAEIPFSLVLDLAVAGLLIATLALGLALHRKLTQLRGDRREMETLIGRLVAASEEARKGLEDLGAHAGAAGARLQQDLDRAKARADELAFLIESAEAAARRLDETRTASRAAGGARGGNAAKPPPAHDAAARAKAPRPKASPPGAAEVSAAEASLLETLQGMR